jgi:hypothetical protein
MVVDARPHLHRDYFESRDVNGLINHTRCASTNLLDAFQVLLQVQARCIG